MENQRATQDGVLTHALARGSGINLVGFGSRALFLFLHSVVAARMFGAEAYGVYAIGTAIVNILSFVGQLGFDRTITRFVALFQARSEPENIIRALRFVLGTSTPFSILIGLGLSIGAEPIAKLFDESSLRPVLRLFGVTVPGFAIAFLLASFSQGFRQMQYKVTALDVVRPGTELAALAILALFGVPQLGLPLSFTFSVLLAVVLLAYYARRLLTPLRVPLSVSSPKTTSSLVKPVLQFALPILVMNILMSATARAPMLMLGGLGTSAMAGVFSVVQRLATLGTMFLGATNTIFGPMVAGLVEHGEFDILSRLYKISTRWILIVSLPLLLTLAFFGAQILRLFGQDFASGAEALWYLVGAAIVNVSTGSCGIILMMSGHPVYSTVNEAIMLGLTVALNWLLIPVHGLLGGVWASAASIVVVNVLRVLQVSWHLKMHPYSLGFVKVAVSAVVMGAFLWAWNVFMLSQETSALVLLLGGLTALLVYAVALLGLGLEPEEREILQTLRRRVRAFRSSGL